MAKRMLPMLILVVMAAAGIAVLVFGPGLLQENDSVAETPRAERASATPVILDTVVLQAGNTRIEAVGTSLARRSVTLYLQVVMEGVQRMREGLEVSVVDPDTSPGVERVAARHVDARRTDGL